MLIKFFTSLNVIVFRLTNGRLGNKLGTQSVLLLHTVGRKSGKEHLTTLTYFHDGANYLVVGSNWGQESQPGWYYNLLAHPKTMIQVGPKVIHVEAHPANQEEYPRLWELVTQKNGQYTEYQQKIKRRIPIMVLVPISNE